MNYREYLINKLVEEAVEIAKEGCKANCFGLDTDYRRNDLPSCRERIISELNDLLAVVDLLVRDGALPEHWESLEMQQLKKERMQKYMSNSIESGTLVIDGSLPLGNLQPVNAPSKTKLQTLPPPLDTPKG